MATLWETVEYFSMYESILYEVIVFNDCGRDGIILDTLLMHHANTMIHHCLNILCNQYIPIKVMIYVIQNPKYCHTLQGFFSYKNVILKIFYTLRTILLINI